MTIELTRAQKIQILAVIAIMGFACYMLWRGMRPQVDASVTAWVTGRQVGLDPKQLVSPTNPVDKTKTELVYSFATYDGRLEIAEITSPTGVTRTITFFPNLRRTEYETYTDPWQTILHMTDPIKKVLSYGAMSAIEKHPNGIIGRNADFQGEQIAAEKEARDQMLTTVAAIDEGVEAGTYQPALYKKLMDALAKYKAKPNGKDAQSAKAAHDVVDLAMQYLAKVNADKMAAMEKYTASLEKIMNETQRTQIAKAGANLRRPRI